MALAQMKSEVIELFHNHLERAIEASNATLLPFSNEKSITEKNHFSTQFQILRFSADATDHR